MDFRRRGRSHRDSASSLIEKLTVVENEQRAREVAEYRQDKANEARTALAPTNFDAMFSSLANKAIEFPVLVRADVQGSAVGLLVVRGACKWGRAPSQLQANLLPVT